MKSVTYLEKVYLLFADTTKLMSSNIMPASKSHMDYKEIHSLVLDFLKKSIFIYLKSGVPERDR